MIVESSSTRLSCKITVIPFSSFPARKDVVGTFHNLENERLRLSCHQPLEAFQAVKVEHDDMLFLGEVLACSPQSEGNWTLLVKVEQILTALKSLLCLREQLLEMQQPVGLHVTELSSSVASSVVLF